VEIPVDVLVRTQAEMDRYRHVHASLECEALERGRVLYGRRQGAARARVAEQGPA
jgi:hypothetical protein